MWSHIYGLDIETDTTPETPEELAAGFKPGNRGLDPRIGRVINVAIVSDEGARVFRGEETDVLWGISRYFWYAPVGLVSTWNGSPFDLPYLQDRYRITGVPSPLLLRPDANLKPKYEPLPGHEGGYQAMITSQHSGYDPTQFHTHLDVAYALKDKVAAMGVPWSLKPVCKAFGIDMVEVDRTKIHLLTPEEQDAYVASDAHGARELAIRAITGTL